MLGDCASKTERTTLNDLAHICERSRPLKAAQKLLLSKLSKHDVDQVYDGIFISSQDFAKDIAALHKAGIKNVLNTAQGKTFMQCDTDDDTYKDTGITYKGIRAYDSFNYDLSQHFLECGNFIDGALERKERVLVHCLQGYSRSPTVVTAFLMQKKGMSAKAALETIRSRRVVRPNDGFLQILLNFENQLSGSST